MEKKTESKRPSDGCVIDIGIRPFVIARDACEKDALDDLFDDKVKIEVKDLRPTGGDYSLVGFETVVAIERKSLSDFLGTLWGKTKLADGEEQQNLGRFAYELSKLARMRLSYVAVEGTIDDVARRIEWRARECRKYGTRQRISFASTMGLVSSLQAEFGVCFCFFKDRVEMAGAIYRDLYHSWRREVGLSKSKIGNYEPSALNRIDGERGK